MSPGQKIVFLRIHSLEALTGARKRRTVFKHEVAWVHDLEHPWSDDIVVQLGNGDLARCDQRMVRLVE